MERSRVGFVEPSSCDARTSQTRVRVVGRASRRIISAMPIHHVLTHRERLLLLLQSVTDADNVPPRPFRSVIGRIVRRSNE